MGMNNQAHVDSIHLALGRFVAAFSLLIHSFEHGAFMLIHAPGLPPSDAFFRIKCLMSGRDANSIRDSFFAVLREAWRDEIKEPSNKILKALNKEAQELAELRNRLLHDVWMFSHTGGEPESQVVTSRFRVSSAKGGIHESQVRTAHDIDGLTSDAKRLADCITAIVFYSSDTGFADDYDLTNRLALVDGKVDRLNASPTP